MSYIWNVAAKRGKRTIGLAAEMELLVGSADEEEGRVRKSEKGFAGIHG